MKNYISTGDRLSFTSGADIASGDAVQLGALFGVATGDIANGAEGTIKLTGIFDLAKAPSQSWAIGAKVYWDATNWRATTTATGNTLIGAAALAVGGSASETIGRVRLNGTV